MTWGRWTALLAVMPIPVLFLIALFPDLAGGVLRQAYAAEPLARAMPGGAPLPRVLMAFAQAQPVLPEPLAGGLAAGLAAWATTGLARGAARLRQARGCRISADPGAREAPEEAFAAVADAQPPARDVAPLVVPAAGRVQPQGADLAARARFVAMSFAFPETCRGRPGVADWPLRMDCRPLRFTLTLHHAALGYRLELCNRGVEALGPLMIRADLVAGESRSGVADERLPLCHYLDGLPAGDSVELSGELRLPLAGIATMRLGTATLLVPLLRLCAQSAREGEDQTHASACFAIGLPPLAAGGGIQPFRLDGGPGIWRRLSARRLGLA